ncbi:two-component system, cell cycle sensor histidine kinase DivJ [Anaerolineae bacterium]|nr:two-component system, cell cycle sensor histidine kinase DivJ [Anaerolineae bacterium]
MMKRSINAILTQISQLSHPHPSITDPEEQRRARLLMNMLLTIVSIGSVVFLWALTLRDESDYSIDQLLIAISLFLVGLDYIHCRRGHTQSAAYLFIGLFAVVGVVVPFIPGSTTTFIYFAFLPVLLSSIFLSKKVVPRLSFGIGLGALLLYALFPNAGMRFNLVAFFIQFLVVGTAIVMTYISYQHHLEQIRQKTLRDANERLRQSEASLERRVESRTRDLEVAADISKQIAAALELPDLLTRITERTRTGFGLFRVLIYLSQKESLELQLASGVGTNAAQDASAHLPIALNQPDNRVAQVGRERKPLLTTVEQLRDGKQRKQSVLTLPLVVGSTLIGVLELWSMYADYFGPDEIRTLTSLSEQIAVAVENAHLYTQQVRIAEELREVDRLKSQFLASMSHELRTPLNAILNFTDFVASGMVGPVNDTQTDLLTQAMESGKHLLSLINDVLDMTKIQSGMLNLFIEDNIDLNAEIKSLTASAEVLIKGKPITLVTDFDSNLPIMIGDRRRVRQVLLNLLSNAAKFTETGTITFSAKQQGDEILFSVTDTGPGIETEAHQMVFEPFQQTEAGIKHAGGTGLGLPISKSLVEAHGGRIWLESEKGSGAKFFVALPHHSPQLIEMMNAAKAPLSTERAAHA